MAYSPLTITGSPPAAVAGTPYSFTPTISGGSGDRASFSFSGGLPTGLSFNATTGTISGTPEQLGAFYCLLNAMDTSGEASLATSIQVNPGVALAISGTPDSATVGNFFSFQPAVTGGFGLRLFSLPNGGQLPAGLSLNSITGLISGTPTLPTGTPQSVALQVLDASGMATLMLKFNIIVPANDGVPSNALTFGGQALTFNSNILTFGVAA